MRDDNIFYSLINKRIIIIIIIIIIGKEKVMKNLHNTEKMDYLNRTSHQKIDVFSIFLFQVLFSQE